MKVEVNQSSTRPRSSTYFERAKKRRDQEETGEIELLAALLGPGVRFAQNRRDQRNR